MVMTLSLQLLPNEEQESSDSDENESYEAIWKPTSPTGPPLRKFNQMDFVFLKVLGKGSFGKVGSV